MENPDQVCHLLSSVQTSAMDELLVDDSAAMTLVGDSVTPRVTATEMAPGARGRKPVVSMMQEDHDSVDYSGSGLVVQPVVVLSGDRSFTRDSGERYCTVAGHYSRSPQPAAVTESSAFWGPPGSFVKSCLRLLKAMIWSKYPRGRVCFRYLQ